MPNESRGIILGSTPLPRIGSRQPKGPGGLPNKPTTVAKGGQGLENRR